MHPTAEWLEVDAQGGFASGTVGGEQTRRYHAVLLVATHPPGDCPFQARSLGELIRVQRILDADQVPIRE